MKPLARVLIAKIVMTALFWCIPLLAVPRSWLVATLSFYGIVGAWGTWKPLGQVYMWTSALATLCITVLLFRHGHWRTERGGENARSAE